MIKDLGAGTLITQVLAILLHEHKIETYNIDKICERLMNLQDKYNLLPDTHFYKLTSMKAYADDIEWSIAWMMCRTDWAYTMFGNNEHCDIIHFKNIPESYYNKVKEDKNYQELKQLAEEFIK